MMWSYITLSDETQIAYSDPKKDGTIEIGIERPVDMGFDSAFCTLPSYRWHAVEGFTDAEIAEFESLLRDNAPLIFELAERRLEEKTVA